MAAAPSGANEICSPAAPRPRSLPAVRASRLLLPLLVAAFALRAVATEPVAATVADLAWLEGEWRGTLANGATFEARYGAPRDGTLLSMSRELRDGRTLGFEFELFADRDGTVRYRPHPDGRPSPHEFPLVALDRAARRAVFENRAHDFPQTFEFVREADDRLVILLRGPGRDGRTREIRYALARVR